MASKTVLLMGPPGSGKSTMACLTAPRKPVHALDIDRKLKAMANLAPAFEKGHLTSWEITESLAGENLVERLRAVATNTKPRREPQGWRQFEKLLERLLTDEEGKRAGTWYIGSLTLLSDHLTQSILYEDPKGNAVFSPRDWLYFLNIWNETISIILNLARSHGKDIICDVHERPGEVAAPGTKIMYTGTGQTRQREYLGPLESKVWASIGGQFGGKIGVHFEEVYGLSVKVDNAGRPTWVCRVAPDGIRDLRCSYPYKEVEVEPDLRKIWNQTETFNGG